METYIDKSYYDGTHNGSSDILRQVFPYLDSTTNRCFNIRYIANPKRENIYTPYRSRSSTTSE